MACNFSPEMSEDQKGNVTMQIAAKRSLALTGLFLHKNWYSDLLKLSNQSALYQQITARFIKEISCQQEYDKLGDHLIALARQAYPMRQFEAVEAVSRLLLALPLSPARQNIGEYYRALSLMRRGHAQESGAMLGRLVETAPPSYRGKVLLSLGSLAFERGDRSSAQRLYEDAGRVASQPTSEDWLALIQARRMNAIFKSIDGDHHGAVTVLEQLLPLARAVGTVNAPVFYEYLNSLSVEYGETGQLMAAGRISQTVMATPYAKAYPEWQETARELAQKSHRSSRSVVSIRQQPQNHNNVLHLPVLERRDKPKVAAAFAPAAPARILDYVKFIRKIAGKKTSKPLLATSSEQTMIPEKSERELFFELMELLSERQFDADQLRTLLEFATRISAPAEAESLEE
jgi:hypothetical protein